MGCIGSTRPERSSLRNLVKRIEGQSLSTPLLDQFFAHDVLKLAKEMGDFSARSLGDATVEVSLESYFFAFGEFKLSIMPTIITDASESLANAVDAKIEVIDTPCLLGFLIDGPHIAVERRGIMRKIYMRLCENTF